MSRYVLGLLLLPDIVLAAAQTPCSPNTLATAAQPLASIRRQLHQVAVPSSDPTVPAAVSTQLNAFKDALAQTAIVLFRCAPATATADELQSKLAAATSANEATATTTVIMTKDGKDRGAYGSDLAVQVVQLFGSPKLFEVDFRYGIECGDDNLLLIFQSSPDDPGSGYRERLRWSAPAYNTVADAFGDFVLLTPLTGNPDHPDWRFLVARGHPGCEATSHLSRFDLDLLRPTDDPSKPAVDWHFEQIYTQDRDVVPRLTTTEDTLEFRLTPKASAPAAAIYRFHLTTDGRVAPTP